MSDLILNDEQQEFQKLAREFAQKELAPKAHAFDQSAKAPEEIFKKAWEIGLVNACVPEEFGGLGLSYLETCVIAEELAAGCAGIAGTIEAVTLAQLVLIQLGSETQQKTFLKPLIEAPVLAGVDAELFSNGAPRLKAAKVNDRFLVNGTAIIANASLCQWFLVAAEDLTAGSMRRLFVIPQNCKGVSRGARVPSVGRKALELTYCQFTDVQLDSEHCLKASNEKWTLLRNQADCLLAAGAVGLARTAMEHAIQYSKERKTFGKAISQHQAVSFMLADMAKEIEAARLLVWTACLIAAAQHSDLVSAAVARSFAQEMAIKVATDAVQVYGGYGYSKEYPVEKLMRDAKAYQVYQGTSGDSMVEIGRQLVSVN